MTGDTHQELAEVLGELEQLGAKIPSFQVARLSQFEAETWLRSEQRRLNHLARAAGDEHE